MQAFALWNAQDVNAPTDGFCYEACGDRLAFMVLKDRRPHATSLSQGFAGQSKAFLQPFMPEMKPAYPLLNAAGKVVSVAPMMDWSYARKNRVVEPTF